MKRIFLPLIALALMTISFASCREENQTKAEELIEEMEADGAEIEKKVDGDETKIKMESEEKEVKIKSEDGETKIKVDDK